MSEIDRIADDAWFDGVFAMFEDDPHTRKEQIISAIRAALIEYGDIVREECATNNKPAVSREQQQGSNEDCGVVKAGSIPAGLAKCFDEWWDANGQSYYVSKPPKSGWAVNLARDAWNAAIRNK